MKNETALCSARRDTTPPAQQSKRKWVRRNDQRGASWPRRTLSYIGVCVCFFICHQPPPSLGRQRGGREGGATSTRPRQPAVAAVGGRQAKQSEGKQMQAGRKQGTKERTKRGDGWIQTPFFFCFSLLPFPSLPFPPNHAPIYLCLSLQTGTIPATHP